MTTPRFVVVGHPNKGKSSIVSTLASDDRVRVAPDPGTTTQATDYPMQVDGRVLYTLVDTPGFQRARRALDWLRQHDTTADRRPEVVRQFIAAHEPTNAFPDEVALLKPLVDPRQPAGLLYVVDGSVPYGPEYEPEMEILRWTGRPSLALINPIDAAAAAEHLPAWEAALGQYFRIVRVFNAVTAEFDKRLELLRAFGQLDEKWRAPLEEAVQLLQSERNRRTRAASGEVATLLADALTLTVEQRFDADGDPKALQPAVLEKFKGSLRRIERQGRDRVEAVYDHHQLERREAEADVEALASDLFSEQTWMQFGLSKARLAALGAAAGGLSAGWVDLALGGASLGGVAAAGAAIGGVLGWMGGGRLAEFKVLHFRMGGRVLRCGPARNINLPFVLLGRARLHHALVARRTHAQRDALEVSQLISDLPALGDAERKAMADVFRRLGKAPADAQVIGALQQELAAALRPRLAADAAGQGAAVSARKMP